MKSVPTKGARIPESGVIPIDKRGKILPSSTEATDLRQSLAANSPRVHGKKKPKEIKESE